MDGFWSDFWEPPRTSRSWRDCPRNPDKTLERDASRSTADLQESLPSPGLFSSCSGMLCLHVCRAPQASPTGMPGVQRGQKDLTFSGTGVNHPVGVLQERQGLLTNEPSLQNPPGKPFNHAGLCNCFLSFYHLVCMDISHSLAHTHTDLEVCVCVFT